MNLTKAEFLAKATIKNHVAHLRDHLKTHKDRFVLTSRKQDTRWIVAVAVFPKDKPFAAQMDDIPENFAKDWITVFVEPDGKCVLNEIANLNDLLET